MGRNIFHFYSELLSVWSWTLPWMGSPQFLWLPLWASCASVSPPSRHRLLSLMCQCLLKEIFYSTQNCIPGILKNKGLSIHKAYWKNGRYAQDGTWSLFSLLDFAVLQQLWGLPALELLGCRHLHHPCGTAHQLTLGKRQHDSSHPTCSSLQGTWEARDKAGMPPSAGWSLAWIPQASETYNSPEWHSLAFCFTIPINLPAFTKVWGLHNMQCITISCFVQYLLFYETL